MRKKFIMISIISAFLFALLCTAFVITPGFQSLIWVMFSSFSIISAINGTIKNLHIYLISIALGWVYAFAYQYSLIALMSSLQLSFSVAMFTGVLLVTAVIMLLHTIALTKTPWNISVVPLCFVPVMSLFGTQGQQLSFINIVIAQVAGILLAVSIALIVGRLLKPIANDKNSI